MRVHADTHHHARTYLDGAFVDNGIEADDGEGWVDVLIVEPDQPLPKEPESVRAHPGRSRFKIARLRGAVRIELSDEDGG